MNRKSLIALLCAASLLFAVSCDGDKTDTPSKTSSGSGSVSSQLTASYEKPAAGTHDGNKAGDYAAEKMFDVTPESIIADQTSLDSYTCESYWLSDTVVGVFYFYSVETMPNYFEPRVDAAFYSSVSGSFGDDTQIVYHSKVGVKAEVVTANGGFAICDGKEVRVYGAEALAAGGDGAYDTYAGTAVLDLCADANGALIPLYRNSNDLYVGNTKVDAGLSDITAGAIGKDATLVAVTDGTTGVLLTEKGEKKGTADLTALDRRVTPFVTADGACFLGKVAGGNGNLTAVLVGADGATSVKEHLFDDYFANTYAYGTVKEADGSLYLVSALAASGFDFADVTVSRLDSSLEKTAAVAELANGWHSYFRYDLSTAGRLLLTENVADGVDIKDYIHLF